jgi:hypothetical protein
MSLLDTASLLVTPNAYKEGKLYSVIPSDGSGDFTFTRATTATRVNSDGLVELVPYNLVQYSQDFSNAAWTKDLSSITYNQPDPFGGNNAALCTFTNLATSRIAQQLSIVAGNTYTLSAWIKGVNLTDFRFLLGTNQVVLVTSQIVNGEWVRVSATVTATTTGGYQQSPARSNNTNGESFYIYGAQLVEGTNALPYQKTETRLNIPRIDYSLGGCPNILLEPQRTNLALQSSSFDSATWTLFNQGAGITPVRTANVAIAPDGTMTADRLQCNQVSLGNGNRSAITQNVSVTSGVVYTFSLYVKSNNGTNQNFTVGNSLLNASAGFSVQGVATNEWTRYIFQGTAAGTGLNAIRIGIIDSVLSTTNDILIWGAQIEAGSYATSYIPTTTASVTRNQDLVSKTGISSLIGQTEGTLYFEGIAEYNTEICSINQSSQNAIFIYTQAGYGVIGYIYADGSGVSFGSSVNPLTKFKAAIAYKTNSMAMYINGNLIQEYTGFSFTPNAALTTLFIAQGGYVQGKEKVQADAIALWKTRLTNTQLAQLTTI